MLIRATHRRLNQRGQFAPLATMVIFTGVLLMVAATNIYRLSKAKLQIQNMADAAALAVASMEAKAVNTVVDRNEWLNHMYGDGYHYKPGVSLPNISQKDKVLENDKTAQAYANLVATINKAQGMFKIAYNNFLGADTKTGSNGSGNAALADILSEIDGLQDPSISYIWVYNNDGDQPDSQMISNATNRQPTMSLSAKLSSGSMKPLKFITEEVTVKVKGKSNTLTKIAKMSGADDDHKVGWMRPDWNNADNTLRVQVSRNGQQEGHWGVGVTIIKNVPMFLFGMKSVTAKSMAYVVDDAGTVTNTVGDLHTPAPKFRPTYYAKLAYHP